MQINKTAVFFLILGYWSVKSSVLLISNRQIQVSPLVPFSNNELHELRSKLGNPNVPIFTGRISVADWQNVTPNYYTSYNPNGAVYPDKNNAHLQDPDVYKSAIAMIQSYTTFNKSQPFLLAISNLNEEKFHHSRIVRTTIIDDAVLYIGRSELTKTYVMLYSMSHIVLKTPTVFTKLSYSYNVTVVETLNETTFTLELRSPTGISYNLSMVFKNSSNLYWSIPPILLTNSTHSNVSVSLDPVKRMFVLKGRAFICAGVSRFVNRYTGIEVKIYNIHLDPHARNRSFSTGYFCLDYVSPAILEAFCIVMIFVIGLAVEFSAISNIKHAF